LTEQAFAVRELTCNRAAVSHARWNSPLIETDLRHALHSQSGKAGAAGRETPIGPYIADFAWLSARIIVEVDGDSHETLDGRRHDVRRDNFLKSQGFTILRFENAQVIDGPFVFLTIEQAIAGALQKEAIQ
jgi:very-short-patch-repair endonuclease